MTIKKYQVPYKAAYQAAYEPVVDDVVLTREYAHVPVDPTPDHKIVVEFAGQWSRNAACLMLGKTEMQKERITAGKVDLESQHRSLAIFKGLEEEGKTLYINIPSINQLPPILLRLAGDLQPVDKETEMDEWDNVLIPVRPLVYANEERQSTQLADAVSGYVYVFWQQKLWRELSLTHYSYFCDTDLDFYRHLPDDDPRRDQRPSEGVPLPHIWLPYKINGEEQTGEKGFALLYSYRRLSWQSIEAIEQAPDDFDTLISADELVAYSQSQCFAQQAHVQDIVLPTLGVMDESKLSKGLVSQTLSFSGQQKTKTAAMLLPRNSGGIGIVLRDQFNQVYQNLPYQLEAGEETHTGITDDTGFIALDEYANLESVLIGLQAHAEDEAYSNRLLVEIGSLKPLPDDEGVKQRLKNHHFMDEDFNLEGDEQTEKALKNLQYFNGLNMDAQVDQSTIDWFNENDAE